MARKSDESAEASTIMARQSERLRRLRRLLGLRQPAAAEAAGITRDSWGRMERGEQRVDMVALAKFCASQDIPAGYVVTGDYAGLHPVLLRDIIRAEEAGEEAEETGI